MKRTCRKYKPEAEIAAFFRTGTHSEQNMGLLQHFQNWRLIIMAKEVHQQQMEGEAEMAEQFSKVTRRVSMVVGNLEHASSRG
jgi:hypothetical protein